MGRNTNQNPQGMAQPPGRLTGYARRASPSTLISVSLSEAMVAKWTQHQVHTNRQSLIGQVDFSVHHAAACLVQRLPHVRAITGLEASNATSPSSLHSLQYSATKRAERKGKSLSVQRSLDDTYPRVTCWRCIFPSQRVPGYIDTDVPMRLLRRIIRLTSGICSYAEDRG